MTFQQESQIGILKVDKIDLKLSRLNKEGHKDITVTCIDKTQSKVIMFKF